LVQVTGVQTCALPIYPRNGQPKTQRSDANVDRVRTLVRSDRRLAVRVTAEELNMNRETERQILKKICEREKFLLKRCLES
jgi:arginyl-tRNA--protein-N-Asp/Glu arginylyltransferase